MCGRGAAGDHETRPRALRGAGLESVIHTSNPHVAREVLMRWESCLGAQSAGVLRAVSDGQKLNLGLGLT